MEVQFQHARPHRDDLTQILKAHTGGDRRAVERILPLVYQELHRIAQGRLRRERPDHTLGATALVHEAYLRLERLDHLPWQSRAHFFAIASEAMRNVLVNYAEGRRAQKRGGGVHPVSIDDVDVAAADPVTDLLELDEALQRLERIDPRQAQVVVCRFFGDMSIEATAEALGCSTATVNRDWAMARAWLARELSGGSVC